MDLAAMLAASEHAADEGVQVLVYPRIVGISAHPGLLDAFFRNVEERAPGMARVHAAMRHRQGEPLEPHTSGLGRTLVLDGDECVDPALFEQIQALECDSLVWLFDPEDPLQAEAALELALDASLHLAPLVVVAAVTGHSRGVSAHGIGAIVHLGEIVSEGGYGDELLIASVPAPSGFVDPPRRLPEPAPILLQRLALHRALAEGGDAESHHAGSLEGSEPPY
jgi:hypothetical protein